jgi:glycosyltransferase involved in cell wall biosynthesis
LRLYSPGSRELRPEGGKVIFSTNRKVVVLIPVYNEEFVITEVLRDVRKAGFPEIVVVDDGSTDETYRKAQQVEGVIAIRHFINRGKGAALKTGIEATKLLGADIVVTMDGDGQHDPGDIARMVRLVAAGNDVVLGTRRMDAKTMPPWKILANKSGNFFTWLLYGLWVNDSQSGFRAFSRRAFESIETRTDRYEYDSEVIREIRRHGLRYVEMPISVHYTPYSQSKAARQTLKGGLKTLFKMFLSS